MKKQAIVSIAQRKFWYLKSPGGELNSNSRFRLQAKLVSCKPRKNVGFTNTRISDQNDLEQVIILMIHPMRHRSSPLRSLKPIPDPTTNTAQSSYRSKLNTSKAYERHKTQIKTKNETREFSHKHVVTKRSNRSKN